MGFFQIQKEVNYSWLPSRWCLFICPVFILILHTLLTPRNEITKCQRAKRILIIFEKVRVWPGRVLRNDTIALVFDFVPTTRTDKVGVFYFVTPMLIFIRSRVSAWSRASSN